MQVWGRLSLRYQLALVVGSLLATLLIAFSVLLFVSVERFLYAHTANQLEKAAEALARSSTVTAPAEESPAEGTATSPSLAQLQALARALVTSNQPSVIIRAPDGRELVREQPSTTVAGQPGTDQRGQGEIEPAVVPRLTSAELVAEGSGEIAVAIPLSTGQGQMIGTLRVAVPAEPLEVILRRLLQYLVVGTLLAVCAGMVLCVAATGYVLRPLGTLVEATAAVARGDLTTRVGFRSGNEIGRVGAAFDDMVARLAVAWTTQRRFLAGAAHELRTPLTAIGGSVEMLQLGAVDHQPERRRRLLHTISEELDRLGRLVHDLLLLNNLEQRPDPVLVPLDLRPLLQQLVEQLRILAPRHTFTIELPTPLPVRGNGDHLRQIFLNLLTNAHTYTPEGGTITIAGRVADSVTVRVSDTGVGIPPDDLPYVWDRLYRVDRARTRSAGGFGLGLAIVKELVHAHNGEVSITSAVRQGTTVRVTLPADNIGVVNRSGSSTNL